MQAALTWVDLTAGDRDRMRRVLDLFNEQGTLDEMGLGSLRDALSDALFPGTSYVHTRLRYVLFVPWLYQRLARKTRAADIEHAARNAEVGLIAPLERNPDDKGIIGVRARHALARLPSSAYWGALQQWGIFLPQQSQGWYHAHFDDPANGRVSVGRADDPGVIWSREPHWHPRLPRRPQDFPGEASFALTPEEADFLRGRLEERCAGTLLAWLARHGCDEPADSFWDDPDALRAPGDVSATIELARRFSLHVEGMPLLYNLLVAERRREVLDDEDSAMIERYRTDLGEWAARETGEERRFAPDELWTLVGRGGGHLPHPQRLFIESWTQRLAELPAGQVADDDRLRKLIADRERRLKGARARLANRNRLLDWRPGVGVGRMDFRWSVVRKSLIDLHRGLAA